MLLLLALAIIIAAMIYFKRRKMNPDKKDSLSSRFFLFKLIDLLKRILFCLIHSSGKISERVSLFRSNQFIGLDDFFVLVNKENRVGKIYPSIIRNIKMNLHHRLRISLKRQKAILLKFHRPFQLVHRR